MSDILKRLAGLSPEKRDLLLKQLQAKGARTPQAPALPALAPRPQGQTVLPLSFSQQRLWFLEQLEPGTARYNVPMAVRLSGALDTQVLERVLDELVRRHEPLRTTFRMEADASVQVIGPVAGVSLSVTDLSELPAERREAEALRLATEESLRPFDLERGPLLRATLLRLGTREHVLLLGMHHIVSDGWSMGVLVREFGLLYAAFAQGAGSPLPELPVQYADHALWQRQWLQGPELERHLAFWREQLSGAARALELPTDKPRPPEQTFHGAALPITLPRELSASLKTLCQSEGVTPFMLLLAAFQVVLGRSSGQEDFCVGTPIAGRDQAQLEGLIGFFANTLALRARLGGNPSFRELLRRVRESTVRALAHQHLPFEKLVEELQPERDLGRSPLFQVLFTFQNTPAPELSLAGLTLRPFVVDTNVARFELELNFGETPSGLQGSLVYNTDLFDAATPARMIEHLRVLLEGVVASPDTRLSELPLLTAAERQRVLVEWNPPSVPFAADTCLPHLFEAQVERTPGGARPRLRGRVAHLPRAQRSAPTGSPMPCGPWAWGRRAAWACAWSARRELVVALLGILKAGGAYVPLDPVLAARAARLHAGGLRRARARHPGARPRALASDAGVTRLERGLARRGVPARRQSRERSGGPATWPMSSTPRAARAGPRACRCRTARCPTSSRPWMHGSRCRARGVWLAVTSISFDISVLELLWTLARGFLRGGAEGHPGDGAGCPRPCAGTPSPTCSARPRSRARW